MKSLYQSEVRDGFFVSSVMKRGFSAVLDVLGEIDRICEKHNIAYFADWGTLLGTVRHAGFIPWDDDFDIAMKRRDYELFLEVSKTELSNDCFISSFYTDSETTNFVSRVYNSHGVDYSREFLEKYDGFPYGTGIDIFPIDYVPRDIAKQEELREKVRILSDRADASTESVKRECLKKIDQLFASVKEDEGDYLASMPQWYRNDRLKNPKEYYDYAVRLPYENTTIPVPYRYLDVLKNYYGDFMRLVRDWDSHEYPSFKRMEEILLKQYKMELFPDYKFKKEHLLFQKSSLPERDKDVVYFITLKPEWWKYYYKLYEEELEKGCEVYVLPVPYFLKGRSGKEMTPCYEGEAFLDIPEVTLYDEVDFKEILPDRIYIQCGFDEFDSDMTVHSDYWSQTLSRLCGELIYVMPYDLEDFSEMDRRCFQTLRYCCNIPGVVFSDKVIVPSECLKERFVESLVQMAGNDTEEHWSKKIVADEAVYDVARGTDGLDESMVPDEWWNYLCDKEGNGKKILVYYTSFSTFVSDPEAYIKKARVNFSTFAAEKEKLFFIWYLDGDIVENLSKISPQYVDVFLNLLEEFKKLEIGVVHVGEYLEESILGADAFYGDAGYPAHLIRQRKKPVMIQNIEV